MSIREKFIKSFGWQALNVTSQVILQLVFISILARQISEEAFGVMAIALVVVGFIEIFSQIGIGPALIQRKNLTQEHLNGAFFISVILGIAFTVGMYLLAPSVAEYYEHPPLTSVLRWISLSFFISALAIVPRSMIIKEMEFKKLFFSSATAMTIGNLGVGLGLAFNGYDLWAYVFALLSQNTLMTILYWIYKPVKIGMSWNWETTKDMIRYGGGSTLFNMFNYAATKVDTLIVGKYAQTDFAGADMERWRNTGIYDRSVYLMGLPITVLGKLSDSVMFSGLSQLQDDKARMQRAFLSAVYHIAILVIPGSVFMIFFAEQITVLFLGPKYLDAVPLVQILFATVGFRSVIKIADSIVRAMDRVYTASLIKASFLICVAIGTYFGLKSGLHGVAWALVLAVFIQFVLIMGFSLHLVDLKPNRLIKKFVPAMLISVVVAVASYIAVKINGNISDNQFVKLIVGLSVNTLTLGIVAWFAPFVFKQGKDDILDELASRLPVQALKKRWKK